VQSGAFTEISDLRATSSSRTEEHAGRRNLYECQAVGESGDRVGERRAADILEWDCLCSYARPPSAECSEDLADLNSIGYKRALIAVRRPPFLDTVQ
jgi:hypothetical protein